MNLRKAMLMATEICVVATAFAVQPMSVRIDDRQGGDVLERKLWIPGGNSLMSADDAIAPCLPPSR